MTGPKVDFADAEREQVVNKRRSEFFLAVRERGFLNASLDELAKIYEEDHPGEETKWEYYQPTKEGGTDLVVQREALGYKLVDASELDFGANTPTAQKSGPVKRGDLVLMAAPKSVARLLRSQDAAAADEDLKAPEEAFRTAVESNKVRTSSGETDHAKAFGRITRKTEEISKQGEASQPGTEPVT